MGFFTDQQPTQPTTGYDSEAGGKPGFFENIGQGLTDSVKAAGMMLGLYKPATKDEATTLRRRFLADASSLAAGIGVGAAAESGGASLGLPVLARMILSGALSGAAGGGVFEKVAGGDVGKGALSGGLFGAALGGLGGLGAQGREAAVAAGEELRATTRQAAQQNADQAIQRVIQRQAPVQAPEISESLKMARRVVNIERPPDITPWEAVGGTLPTQAAPFPSATGDLGETVGSAAAPPRAAYVLANAGGKSKTTQAAISSAIKEFRLARLPKGRLSPQRIDPLADLSAVNPANEITSVNAGVKGVLTNMPEDESRFSRVWNDITKIYRRGIQISGSAISKMGASGARLAAGIDDVTARTERLASADMQAMRAAYRGLTKAQRLEVTGVLNGDTIASSPEVDSAASQVRVLLDKIANEGQDVGLREISARTGKIRPFAYMDNYWPYTYDQKVLQKVLKEGSPEEADAIQRVLALKTGAYTPDQARILLRRFALTPPEFRYNNLQFARDLALPNFERDPFRVLPHYFMRAWKRIETAREFGPTDKYAASLLSDIMSDGHDWEMARDVYRAFADKLPIGFQDLIRATRSFNTISLLSTSGLVQFAQHANTIAYTGFKNYIRGLGAYFTKEGRQYAARTGAYLQELLGEMTPEEVPPGIPFVNFKALKNVITGPNRSANWLQYIGLTPLDKANRAIAALAGRFHADEVASKYADAIASGSRGAIARQARELIRLRLNPDEVAATGTLTPEQRLIASQSTSHITQFRGGVLDMPAWARTTAMGRLAYLFKTFSVQQFRFSAMLLDEAKRGNVGPMLKFLAASGTLTPAVGMAVRAARGRPAPDNPAWAYLEASLNAGSVGIAYDALRAAAEGPEWILGLVAGPTASQLAALTSESYQAATGKPIPLMRDTLRHTPLIGPHLANWLLPTKAQ